MKSPRSIGLGCGVAAALCLGTVAPSAATAAAVPTGPGSLSGMWANAGPPTNAVRTADGKAAPLQPWAAQLLAKRVKAAGPGHSFAPAMSRCLPAGVPAMMLYPGRPIQILEEPDQVTMLNATPNYFRVIRLNQPHREDPDPTYKGDSIGHWDGDTLVVDTIGFNDVTALDAAGTPHSADLHVVERYRRVAEDAIEVAITLDDPKAFTRSWTTKARFKPVDARITQSLCDNKRAALAVFHHPSVPPLPAGR